MIEVLEKIKRVRKEKGISHEYLAYQLNISQAAYSKLERNDTKLTVERLYKISQILETSVPDLLTVEQVKKDSEIKVDYFEGYSIIENLFLENKKKCEKITDLYEARLRDKDALIELLLKKN